MSTVFEFGLAIKGVSLSTDSEGFIKVLSFTNDVMQS